MTMLVDGTSHMPAMIDGKQIRVNIQNGARIDADDLNSAFEYLLKRIETLESALADYGLLVYEEPNGRDSQDNK